MEHSSHTYEYRCKIGFTEALVAMQAQKNAHCVNSVFDFCKFGLKIIDETEDIS